MDLSAIGDEEMETLKSYEGQNLTFTIANKEMDPVYTTGSSQDNLYQDERQVHRNIVVYRKFLKRSKSTVLECKRKNVMVIWKAETGR